MPSSFFAAGEFGRTIGPAPLLNAPDFDLLFCGKALPLDNQGLVRQLEMILLKGSKVKILARFRDDICTISTTEYPSDKLYIDTRFLEPIEEYAPERTKKIPPSDTILSKIAAMQGLPYIWGGNWSVGIPEITEFYPENNWSLKGVDCSGLLYEATNGATPRNTGQLVSYGVKVPIEGKPLDQIIASLKPLDLIVWKGHVLIVVSPDSCIESRGGQGVVISSLEKRLQEIASEKKPVDEWYGFVEEPRFVVRRWHPESRFL